MSVAVEQKPMTDEQYHASAGLSFSGMKDLAISPLRYWYLHINPNRPVEEETPAMRFGSALHCAVLEPDQFAARYAGPAVIPDGALDTIEHIRTFIRDKGYQPKGTRKDDLIAQALTIEPTVAIVGLIESAHEEAYAGKVFLSADEMERVEGCASALRAEPSLQPILAEGKSEVPLYAKDPGTGVLLRCKLDWMTPSLTLDIKTFSQQRGKSIDKCVHDAIYYEHYNWQGYLYTTIRTLLGHSKPRYLMAFVESDPPHEVRLKELRPTIGNVCLYWEKARLDVRELIDLYARCQKRFGESPWRADREIELLTDDDIPQTAFAAWA